MNELKDELYEAFDKCNANIISLSTARTLEDIDSIYKSTIQNLQQLVNVRTKILYKEILKNSEK